MAEKKFYNINSGVSFSIPAWTLCPCLGTLGVCVCACVCVYVCVGERERERDFKTSRTKGKMMEKFRAGAFGPSFSHNEESCDCVFW